MHSLNYACRGMIFLPVCTVSATFKGAAEVFCFGEHLSGASTLATTSSRKTISGHSNSSPFREGKSRK